MKSSLENLWIAHMNREFPDCRGEEIQGIDLVLLDSTAAGCISSLISASKSNYDKEKIDILKKCIWELETILRKLHGYSKEYFESLKEVSVLIIQGLEK